MSTDLVIAPHGLVEQLIDPNTGEVVPIGDAPAELIAHVMGRLQRTIDEATELRRDLGRHILPRMDQNASWTVHTRGVKVSAPSAKAESWEWNAELLHELLDGLVNAEPPLISRDAALRACSTRIEYVTHKAGLNALEKIPPVWRIIIRARTSVAAKPRSVRVEVDHGEL
jgi:hypothetical protein